MSKICPNCNQANLSQAAFCSNCASPLGQQNFGEQQNNQPNFGGQGQNFAQSANSSGGASQKATAALVLAIAGLFCCSVLHQFRRSLSVGRR